MPNWVENTMRIKKTYLSRILNDKDEVDFNIAMPMPDSITNTEDGSNTQPDICYYITNKLEMPREAFIKNTLAQQICVGRIERVIFSSKIIEGLSVDETALYDLYDRTKRMRKNDDEESYERGKRLVDNYTKYDCATWYDWANKYWGCKWNANTTNPVENDPSDKDYVKIYFNTPWSAPQGWCERLCEMHIPFRLEWIEEQGYHGEILSDGTTFECNDLPFVDNDEECDDDDDDTND